MDYIAKPPSTPEEFACATLEIFWDTVNAIIQAALLAPEQGAKIMKSAIVALEKMVYPNLLILVEEAEDGLVKACTIVSGLRQSDSNDGDTDWCKILFNCRAFIEIILNESMRGIIVSMLPFVSEEEKARLTTDYNAFATYVCKMSLADILNAMTGALVAEIFKKIAFISEKADTIQGVNYILSEYDSLLQSAYVYEVLKEYDKFALCAFTVCDFDKKQADAKTDVFNRLYLYQAGEGLYQIDTSVSFIDSCYTVERNFNRRVNALKDAVSMGEKNGLDACDYVMNTIAPEVWRRQGQASGLDRLTA